MTAPPSDRASWPHPGSPTHRFRRLSGPVRERVGQLLPASGTVLAIADDDGANAVDLVAPRRRVVAVQLSDAIADTHLGHLGVSWLLAGPGELPLADSSVDGAVAAWAYFLSSTPDPSRGLSELHRVVRPGGPIVVVSDAVGDTGTGSGSSTRGRDLGWFRDRGFDVEVVDEVAVAATSSTGPPDVTVRGMRLDEAERVGALTLASYDAHGVMRGPYRRFLADPLQRLDGATAVLVAELGGQVVGTVTYVRPGDAEWEGRATLDGDCGFRVLAVAPDLEGRGVGRALVETCLLRARESGCRRMVLTSMAWMRRAHHFYRLLGFDRRPDLDVRFPGGDGVAFTLDLVPDAAQHFPPPGPVPDEPPWFEEAWRS